jgi:hypothetical protein
MGIHLCLRFVHKRKNPPASVAGGLGVLLNFLAVTSGHRSPPAWGRMMVVMTVMAVALHLTSI